MAPPTAGGVASPSPAVALLTKPVSVSCSMDFTSSRTRSLATASSTQRFGRGAGWPSIAAISSRAWSGSHAPSLIVLFFARSIRRARWGRTNRCWNRLTRSGSHPLSMASRICSVERKSETRR